MQFQPTNSRLYSSLHIHQLFHQRLIHRLSLPLSPGLVKILPTHTNFFTQHLDRDLFRALHGTPFDLRISDSVIGCFFLNSSGVTPIRSHATRKKPFSRQQSICASATAALRIRICLRASFNSSISFIVSIRILLGSRSSLPYFRTHFSTVTAPLIPYAFFAACGDICLPRPISSTTCRLNASL